MKPSPTAGTSGSDLRALLSILRRRRAKLFVYGFVFAFAACTAYVAFNPSSGGGTYSDFFATTAPYKSHFSSSSFSRYFPDIGSASGGPESGGGDSGSVSTKGGVLGRIRTEGGVGLTQFGVLGVGDDNRTTSGVGSSQSGILGRNQTCAEIGFPPKALLDSNRTSSGVAPSPQSAVWKSNQTSSGVRPPPLDGGLVKNQTMAPKALPSPQTQKTTVGSSPQRTPPPPPANNQISPVAAATSKSNAPSINPSIRAPPPTKNQSPKSSVAAPPLGGPSSASVEKSGQKGAPGDKSKQSASMNPKDGQKKDNNWSLDSMKGCDIFHGKWVRDDSYPLYPEGSCPHIDEPFNCYLNGRPDRSYQTLRWQPHGCNIPRLNATDMLERLRRKRLVFVGDSLNRNMWESLVCFLRNSIKHKKNVFEASGRRQFRTEGSYSFIFNDYGCSVEFFRSPFLVQEWEMPDTNGKKKKKKETLRLDIIEMSSSRYKDADIIVFNTGHWWTHDKTSKGKDYYQEGNHVYSNLSVVEAFHKALNTWANWVDVNINPQKTLVFFTGYSASHFSGGQWNSGGQCDKETEPIKNEKYLSPYPTKMGVLEAVLKGMKTPISYLNITRMTDYRKEAHPSIYGKPHLTEAERKSPDRYQDCSHWCLPGVPDSWNELLYAQILIKQHQL